MKRLVIIALTLAMVAGIGIGTASAANSLEQGNINISVGMGDSIFNHNTTPEVDSTQDIHPNNVVDLSARYLITKDLAIIGGFGLEVGSGDYESTYFSFTGGVRKYISTNDFAPFVGGQITYATYKADDTSGLVDVTVADLNAIDLSAVFGAEYFVGPQFSLEGSVGIGFGQVSNDLTNTDKTYFGTRTVGVKANFYF